MNPEHFAQHTTEVILGGAWLLISMAVVALLMGGAYFLIELFTYLFPQIKTPTSAPSKSPTQTT